MERISLTEAEMLEDLLREIGVGPGPRGITTVEIAAQKGWSIRKTKDEIIRPLVHAGRLEPTMVERSRKDGPHWLRTGKVQGYVRV